MKVNRPNNFNHEDQNPEQIMPESVPHARDQHLQRDVDSSQNITPWRSIHHGVRLNHRGAPANYTPNEDLGRLGIKQGTVSDAIEHTNLRVEDVLMDRVRKRMAAWVHETGRHQPGFWLRKANMIRGRTEISEQIDQYLEGIMSSTRQAPTIISHINHSSLPARERGAYMNAFNRFRAEEAIRMQMPHLIDPDVLHKYYQDLGSPRGWHPPVNVSTPKIANSMACHSLLEKIIDTEQFQRDFDHQSGAHYSKALILQIASYIDEDGRPASEEAPAIPVNDLSELKGCLEEVEQNLESADPLKTDGHELEQAKNLLLTSIEDLANIYADLVAANAEFFDFNEKETALSPADKGKYLIEIKAADNKRKALWEKVKNQETDFHQRVSAFFRLEAVTSTTGFPGSLPPVLKALHTQFNSGQLEKSQKTHMLPPLGTQVTKGGTSSPLTAAGVGAYIRGNSLIHTYVSNLSTPPAGGGAAPRFELTKEIDTLKSQDSLKRKISPKELLFKIFLYQYRNEPNEIIRRRKAALATKRAEINVASAQLEGAINDSITRKILSDAGHTDYETGRFKLSEVVKKAAFDNDCQSLAELNEYSSKKEIEEIISHPDTKVNYSEFQSFILELEMVYKGYINNGEAISVGSKGWGLGNLIFRLKKVAGDWHTLYSNEVATAQEAANNGEANELIANLLAQSKSEKQRQDEFNNNIRSSHHLAALDTLDAAYDEINEAIASGEIAPDDTETINSILKEKGVLGLHEITKGYRRMNGERPEFGKLSYNTSDRRWRKNGLVLPPLSYRYRDLKQHDYKTRRSNFSITTISPFFSSLVTKCRKWFYGNPFRKTTSVTTRAKNFIGGVKHYGGRAWGVARGLFSRKKKKK